MSDTTQSAAAAPTESLSQDDKHLLEKAKLQRELVLEKAKVALSASELSEANYKNLIMQLAQKYKLQEGDQVNEEGQIIRKSATLSMPGDTK